MKKKFIVLLLIPWVLVLFSLTFSGKESDSLMDQAKEEIGYATFFETIPEASRDFLEEYGIDISSEEPSIGINQGVNIVLTVFFSVFKENLPILTVGIALLILFKLLSAICFDNDRVVESLGYLAVVGTGVYSFSVIENLLTSLTQVSRQSASFLTAALPVMYSSQIWAGSQSGAVALSGTLPIILTVMSTAVTALYHPLCWFCFAASLSGFYNGSLSLRPFVMMVKKFCVRGIEIFSGLSIGVFCVQRIAAMSSDTVARRGAHFALVQMLPVAGNALGEGIESVYACGKSLCGKIGVVCVLVVAALFATPCILGFCFVFLYSVLSSIGSALGGSLFADFFADVKDTFVMMTSFSVCSLVVVSSALLLLTGG